MALTPGRQPQIAPLPPMPPGPPGPPPGGPPAGAQAAAAAPNPPAQNGQWNGSPPDWFDGDRSKSKDFL